MHGIACTTTTTTGRFVPSAAHTTSTATTTTATVELFMISGDVSGAYTSEYGVVVGGLVVQMVCVYMC